MEFHHIIHVVLIIYIFLMRVLIFDNVCYIIPWYYLNQYLKDDIEFGVELNVVNFE